MLWRSVQSLFGTVFTGLPVNFVLLALVVFYVGGVSKLVHFAGSFCKKVDFPAACTIHHMVRWDYKE